MLFTPVGAVTQLRSVGTGSSTFWTVSCVPLLRFFLSHPFFLLFFPLPLGAALRAAFHGLTGNSLGSCVPGLQLLGWTAEARPLGRTGGGVSGWAGQLRRA